MNPRAIATFALPAIAAPCMAASIPIVNSGFEGPATATFTNGNPTGWTIAGNSGGVWNINGAPLGFWSSTAPEGSQVGWVAGVGNPGGASLSQTLAASLASSTLYTMTGYVGHPIGAGGSTGTTYTVSLIAGATVLASLSGTGPEGKFAAFSLQFDSTGSGLIGQALTIRLSSSQPQTAFDDIGLTADAITIIPLPGAGLMATAGLGVLAAARRRR